jgi:hypothetical protein
VLSGGYFFILQSFTTSKMRKFQTYKTISVAQSKSLLDQKLVVWWDYEQLLRRGFFMFWGAKKFLKFLLEIL